MQEANENFFFQKKVSSIRISAFLQDKKKKEFSNKKKKIAN
jgi:hypothetical protein